MVLSKLMKISFHRKLNSIVLNMWFGIVSYKLFLTSVSETLISLPVKYTPSSRSRPSSNICGMESCSDLDLANLDNFSYNNESTCLPKSAEFSDIAFSANSLFSTSSDLPLASDFLTRDIPENRI